MEIKALSIQNINQIYDICVENFGEESWSKQQILDGINDKNYINLGVFDDENLCCYAMSLESPDDINLLLIATKTEHKRKGYAKMLIQRLAEIADKNKKSFSLEVKNTNASAISLYKSQNFEVMHTRKKYYKDGSDALIMFHK